MRVALVQLGCPKNLVDGEWILGQVRAAGHEVIAETDADAVIVNTCGFIDAAKEESVNSILAAAELKRQGRIKKLIVAGCLVQRYKDDLRREIPEIDGFIPLAALGEAVRLLEAPDPSAPLGSLPALYDGLQPRLLSTPPHIAYVKISEGCDHPCSFCSIPSIKGVQRSRPVASVVREVRRLAESGVREVLLIAQDTTDYGRDLGLEDGLAALLDSVEDVDGLRWVRILYTYPNRLTPRILDAMARSKKVVPYLDLPLQHSHPDILSAMKRGGGGESFMRLLERARSAVPGLAVRSAFIVGFPGEKRSHFLHLLDFIREARMDHVGVFTYSREEGTEAHPLGDPVDPRTKARRRDALLEAQQAIALEKQESFVGKRIKVMVDGVCEETEHLLQGRMATQAPEIDGRVLINDGFAAPGTIVTVKVEQAGPYDLVGGIVPARRISNGETVRP
jgi:ribosomal protein S12 methylthiotransferase